MAGIHGFRDLPQEDRNRQNRSESNSGGSRFAMLGYGFTMGTSEEARKESFGQMLKNIFCPFFEVRSFVFITLVIDVVMFIITVFYDFNTSKFLTPTYDSLDTFGAKNPQKQQEGQVWRWVTPMFLHAGLTHLAFNMIMQLILGFRLEPTVGWKRTGFVYLISGMGGILFSSLLSDSLSVGASTAIFGMMSAMIAWIIMNWSSLGQDPSRCITLFWLIMLVVFNFLFGFVSFT